MRTFQQILLMRSRTIETLYELDHIISETVNLISKELN